MSLEDDVEACIEIKSADKGVSLIQLKILFCGRMSKYSDSILVLF